MKFNKFFKFTASFLIIFSMILIPFFNVQKANAQLEGLGSSLSLGGNAGGSGGSTSLSGILSNLGPLVSKLPGCTDALGKGVKNLFSGIKNMGKTPTDKTKGKTDSLTGLGQMAGSEAQSVPVFSTSLESLSNQILTTVKNTDATSTKTNTAVVSDNKNNTCLNDIGKAVIKQLVDKMTVSIVNWIQTGNGGDSFFVKNPSQYFKNLAKDQMLAFGQEINDAKKFPFGKNFIVGMANTFNNKFQDNAQYSLNKVIEDGSSGAFSDTAFFGDFSKGGWGAWDALTQNPANNPLGFTLMASNELQKRIEDQATETTNTMLQSGGYLNMDKCVDPEGVTKEENRAALANSGWTDAQGTYSSTGARKCNRWETVTPGSLLANEMTKSMDNSKNALLSADTLNGAISAILDAALAKLSSTLADPNKGLAGISPSDVSNSYSLENYDDGGLSSSEQTQVEMDYSSYQRDGSPWLQSHPDFDIRYDINQALIDEQRTYIDKLKQQNVVLPKLIKNIYQLDYCIPGPHPGWEEDARRNLDSLASRLSQNISHVYDMTGDDIFKLLDSLSLGALGTVVDTVNSYTFNCGDQGVAKQAKLIAREFNSITGMNASWDGRNNSAFCVMDGFTVATDEILNQYADIIQKHYNPKTLPSVAKEAENEFYKINGYEQLIKNNEGAIAYQEGVIKRLQTVRDGVSALDENSPTYQSDLQKWKNSFFRVSQGLVSGGDIAHVDDLINQAQTESDYVYNDLLQGPAGCEAELKTWVPDPLPGKPDNFDHLIQMKNWQDWTHVRPDYPKSITDKYPLYTYSNKNQYDYTKGLDGVGYVGTITNSFDGKDTGIRKAFLGDVLFWDGWSGVWSDPYWTDAIDLHKGQDNAILNFNSPYHGGNAVYFEQGLHIY